MRARFWSVSALLALMLVAPAQAQNGERPMRRTGSEQVQGGLTVAEQVARQVALNEQLMGQMPAGTDRAPVSVELTAEDRERLAVRPPSGTAPLRIGVVKELTEPVGKPWRRAFNRGVIDRKPDGGFTWAVQVSSPGAQALRVHFVDFELPEGTEAYFFGPNGQADGPYTGAGRNGDGDFWTRSIAADHGWVLVRYTGNDPGTDEGRMGFRIADIGVITGRPAVDTRNHDTWPCADNVSCLVDATCGNVGPAEAAKDAVAKMEWISGAFINTCTGGLIADTDAGTQIPYFLTANHCLSSNSSNLETFFDYTTSTCNGACPHNILTGTPPPASTVGATVAATGSDGDFTLLTLNQAPPAGAVFLGWNNAPIANTNGASLHRISNANFGPQVYSEHEVDTGSPTCTGLPRGEAIYSTDVTGATMGGSSGAPVVNSSGEIVGQLTGCCGFNCGNECDSANNWTIDGALAHYWASVSDFLDPQGGGGCTSDGECDDGQFCTGTETCVSGSCQSSGDPCSGGTTCNESTNSCETPACDNDGTCEAGEDCNNCPNDCRQKTNGSPNSRYCCDGDLPDCGNAACSESGWSCGSGGGGCTSNAECDDSQFCNGTETCSGGSCQGGSDPCPGQGCDEGSDTCVSCGGSGATCSADGDCCSNKCRGGTCRGN